MKVLVAGLSRQSSAVVEMIIGSVFRGATVVQHPRGPDGKAAAALEADRFDLRVLDLVGIGWDRCTPERETELNERVLGDRPAIVLLPAGAGGWIESPVLKDRTQQRIALTQPASMNSLLDAMLLLRHGLLEPVQPAGVPARGSHAAVGPMPTADAATMSAPAAVVADPPQQAVPPAASVAEPAAVVAPRPTIAFRLRRADRRAVVRACPKLREQAFLNVVLDLLEGGKSCEMRIGNRAVAVFCPQRNWVASNLSVALRQRIAQHRQMLDIIEVRPLTPKEAGSAARPLFGRRRDGRRALDTFVFSFVFDQLGDDPPDVDGSLEFSLGRLPDFTRLPTAGDLFLQLALYAMPRKLTVTALRAAFSGHEPRLIGLFAVCALLSGMAVAAPAASSTAVAAANAAAPRAPAAPRGLIRSLLSKLF